MVDVEKINKDENVSLLVYEDDDGVIKSQKVIILSETDNGIKFKYPRGNISGENIESIFLPWSQIKKIKVWEEKE